jgi:hypothetical protein
LEVGSGLKSAGVIRGRGPVQEMTGIPAKVWGAFSAEIIELGK